MQGERREAVISPLAVQIVLGVGSGLAMAYAAYVLIAPKVGPPPLFPFQDKVFHAICFAVLTGPAVLVLPRKYAGFWLAHMAALGLGIELVQWRWLAERSGSVVDFLADAVGIAAAAFVAAWLRGFVLRRAAGGGGG